MNKYSTEEKQQAIDLYFKNGCNMTTVTGTVAQNVSLLAQYMSHVKSLKVQEKSFQAFFVSLLECSQVERNKSSQI